VREVSLVRMGEVRRRERQLRSNQARRKARLARKNILSTPYKCEFQITSTEVRSRIVEFLVCVTKGNTGLRVPYGNDGIRGWTAKMKVLPASMAQGILQENANS
jgi:hypothetical protein